MGEQSVVGDGGGDGARIKSVRDGEKSRRGNAYEVVNVCVLVTPA